VDIVRTAYHGFNASMFAYGQTSSGKSFSMMGVRGTALVGLIPRIAHLLFHVVAVTPSKEFFVEGSFLEIYNEKLRDLLDGKGADDLKVRESPQLGVHVAGLSRHQIKTSDAVEKIIEDGTGNRTVAATKYNSESSRSHAVFELHIQQKYKDEASGEDMQSKTKIALIDLAGSERSDKLGSVGKALQEGNNINKSLTVLGRCIKGLVEQANHPKKKILVPFRESVLTFYLRESLAGNAKTTMLAAVSPAGSNEEETLSTLRYAASAKQIKTSAKKNEDPLKAKVRELSGEVEKLRAMLAAGGGGGGGKKKKRATMIPGKAAAAPSDDLTALSDADKEAYLKELEEQMSLMGMGGMANKKAAAAKTQVSVDAREVFPHLSCLNKDEMMSHAMVISMKDDKCNIGRSDGSGNDFEIDGMGICERHCRLAREGAAAAAEEGAKAGEAKGSYYIELCDEHASVHVNGEVLNGDGERRTLKHLDRVIIGPCRVVCLFLEEKISAGDRAAQRYDVAFRELMSGDDSAERLLMSPRRQELLDTIQNVDGIMLKQANTVASELCTNIQFVSQLLMGSVGMSQAEIGIDALLDANEQPRIKICCVAGGKRVETQADLQRLTSEFKLQQKGMALARKGGSTETNVVQLRKHASQLFGKKVSVARMGSSADPDTPKPPPAKDGVEGGAKGAPKVENPEGAVLVEDVALDEEDPLAGMELETMFRGPKVNLDLMLFDIDADDFGDLLAELKSTHAQLSGLLGGVSSGGQGMIRAVFEAVDTDRSGLIDKYELQACIEKFNIDHDPKFFQHVLREEGIREDDELDFNRFEVFLIKFLQHQFYKKIESFVTNKPLFLMLGGRSVKFSHRGTLLEVKSRASFAEDGKISEESGEQEDEPDAGLTAEEREQRNEEEAAAARKKKMGKEAKQARMRQRMKQNAVVTNFITTLKGDLQKAMLDLEELAEEKAGGSKSGGGGGGGGGDDKGKKESEVEKKKAQDVKSMLAAGAAKLKEAQSKLKDGVKRKKKRSDQDVYSALSDKVKKAIKDLEQQHKSTLMVSKERDQLEDYLTRMLAERDANIPDGTGGDDAASESMGLPGLSGGLGDTGGMQNFISSIGGKPGRALDL